MSIGPGEITQLWNAHAASLTLLARARCASPDDCVQEAFVRLALQREMPRDPIAWLSKVVRNEAITQWRSESRRTRREEFAATERKIWFESQDANAVDPIDVISLTDAMSLLEVDDREIVIAHIWTGLSFRQIAESFEQSLASVHRRYQESLERLRRTIDGNGPIFSTMTAVDRESIVKEDSSSARTRKSRQAIQAKSTEPSSADPIAMQSTDHG